MRRLLRFKRHALAVLRYCPLRFHLNWRDHPLAALCVLPQTKLRAIAIKCLLHFRTERLRTTGTLVPSQDRQQIRHMKFERSVLRNVDAGNRHRRIKPRVARSVVLHVVKLVSRKVNTSRVRCPPPHLNLQKIALPRNIGIYTLDMEIVEALRSPKARVPRSDSGMVPPRMRRAADTVFVEAGSVPACNAARHYLVAHHRHSVRREHPFRAIAINLIEKARIINGSNRIGKLVGKRRVGIRIKSNITLLQITGLFTLAVRSHLGAKRSTLQTTVTIGRCCRI